jgi:hypothetical protein
MGQRNDGGLWIHYGNYLGFIETDGSVTRIRTDRILGRGTEWAGSARYIPKPESLWVGIDGRGRSLTRVDLAKARRKAKRWK